MRIAIAARPSGSERRWKMRIDRWIEQGRSLSSLNMISIMGNLWYLVAATPPPKKLKNTIQKALNVFVFLHLRGSSYSNMALRRPILLSFARCSERLRKELKRLYHLI